MNENQKNRLALIVSGLAASGHYTYLKQVDTGETTCFGKIFKDEPFLRSEPWDKKSEIIKYEIIEAALTLLQELEKTEL